MGPLLPHFTATALPPQSPTTNRPVHPLDSPESQCPHGSSRAGAFGCASFRFGFRLRFWGFGGLSSFFLGFARAFFGADFFLFDAKHPRRCLPAGAAAFFIALGGILAGTQPSSPGLNSPISRTYNPFPYQRISGENPTVFCTAYEVRSCLTTSRFRMYHSTRENKSNNFFKDIYYNWHNSHTKLPLPSVRKQRTSSYADHLIHVNHHASGDRTAYRALN